MRASKSLRTGWGNTLDGEEEGRAYYKNYSEHRGQTRITVLLGDEVRLASTVANEILHFYGTEKDLFTKLDLSKG